MPDSSIDRRALLGLIGGAAVTASASPLAARAGEDEMVRLWPGRPPGGGGESIRLKIVDNSRDPARPDRSVSGVAEPAMIVRRARDPNGAGVLVIPGGGYVVEAYDNEGTRQADWLNARGITAFILRYRLPAEGWTDRRDAPLRDAQRAMRLIRTNADRYSVARDRLVVMGFSAGGHLAGSLATRADERVYAPVDAADRASARPDLAALCYPVVTMSPPFAHGGSRDALLGPNADDALRRRYSIEQRVTQSTPPMFLMHAGDDDVVPVENSLMLYRAMREARRPVAMHLFERGGHGFGVGLPSTAPAAAWPDLLTAHMRSMKLLG